jgi:hypothetical protein
MKKMRMFNMVKKFEGMEGMIGKNKYGSEMIIEKYNNFYNVYVVFPKSNYRKRTSFRAFVNGNVKNPYDKTVYNIGFLGKGKYEQFENGINTSQYLTWSSMMRRCYNSKYHEKHPTYKDCEVCDEWLNFQNFAQWYDENYYKIEGQRMELDKDILIKGNKVYSPETCVFVPGNINLLFIKNNAMRGDLPIGVYWYKKRNMYRSHCQNGKGQQVTIGHFSTPEEAFYAYKKFKEKIIKQVADEYKNKIPKRLHDAMYNYIVEITD